jgi:hypothetical protein
MMMSDPSSFIVETAGDRWDDAVRRPPHRSLAANG